MITPLDAFATHPFRFVWRRAPPTSFDQAEMAVSKIEEMAADLVFQNEPNPASKSALSRLFMPYHQNGTFMIGVRREVPLPQYLRGESGDLTSWLKAVTRSDLVRMLYAQALPSHFQSHELDRAADVIAGAFQYCGSNGRLCDQVPNQNYIDYIRRAIGLYIYHDADHEFDTESEYNDFATEVALGIIERYLERELAIPPTLQMLRTLMIYSLLAGVIALDMKCSHCAASQLTADNAAASQGEIASARIPNIYQWLVKKAKESNIYCTEIFAWEAYQALVLSRPCTMYFFPDDIGETFIDLFRLQAEMVYNSRLQVIFVPRNGRFHNDCALGDVGVMLERQCLKILRRFMDEGRFAVNTNGPKNGAVEGPKMNRHLVDGIVGNADVLFFKGSRTFEMMATGIRIPTFSGQTVSREFSESVTGASASVGVPVLRSFRVFPDYWGFTERYKRIEPLFPTGQLAWQASMTAIDSARFTDSVAFRNACAMRPIEDVTLEILTLAERHNIPPTMSGYRQSLCDLSPENFGKLRHLFFATQRASDCRSQRAIRSGLPPLWRYVSTIAIWAILS